MTQRRIATALLLWSMVKEGLLLVVLLGRPPLARHTQAKTTTATPRTNSLQDTQHSTARGHDNIATRHAKPTLDTAHMTLLLHKPVLTSERPNLIAFRAVRSA